MQWIRLGSWSSQRSIGTDLGRHQFGARSIRMALRIRLFSIRTGERERASRSRFLPEIDVVASRCDSCRCRHTRQHRRIQMVRQQLCAILRTLVYITCLRQHSIFHGWWPRAGLTIATHTHTFSETTASRESFIYPTSVHVLWNWSYSKLYANILPSSNLYSYRNGTKIKRIIVFVSAANSDGRHGTGR